MQTEVLILFASPGDALIKKVGDYLLFHPPEADSTIGAVGRQGIKKPQSMKTEVLILFASPGDALIKKVGDYLLFHVLSQYHWRDGA
jgi:hypothetical protein